MVHNFIPHILQRGLRFNERSSMKSLLLHIPIRRLLESSSPYPPRNLIASLAHIDAESAFTGGKVATLKLSLIALQELLITSSSSEGRSPTDALQA